MLPLKQDGVTSNEFLGLKTEAAHNCRSLFPKIHFTNPGCLKKVTFRISLDCLLMSLRNQEQAAGEDMSRQSRDILKVTFFLGHPVRFRKQNMMTESNFLGTQPPLKIADIYISISMGTFGHRKYKSRGEDGNK